MAERVNLATLDDFPNLCCYLHLHIVHDLRFLVPFSPFKKEVLKLDNVSRF